MKIVVIGGTGLIGSKLVEKLRKDGHEPLAAAPDTGVNTITGEGLAEALEGAQVVVDVANAPAWEDAAVLDFFQTSSRNLLAAEAAAGVGHHVTLSVVGTDRLPESRYFRAKVAQEELVKAGPVPYTIVRATQFFEFICRIADSNTDGNTARLSPALVQPEAADDVAATVADVAVGAPLNDTVELAGPEAFRLDELARRLLSATGDPRQVTADVHARYFGAELDDGPSPPATTHASRPPTSRTGSASPPARRADPNGKAEMITPMTSTDPLVEALATRLRLIDVVAWQRIAMWAEASELSFEDLRLLLALARKIDDGPAAVSELAELAGFSLDVAYPAIHSLRGRGYLNEERRQYALSPQGRELLAGLDAAHREGVQAYVDQLDRDEHQRLSETFANPR